jgi:sodium-dependent dicarboxylate transporter 2/3/5
MMIGAPIVVVLYIFLYFYLELSRARRSQGNRGQRGNDSARKSEIRRVDARAEINRHRFSVAVALWIFSGLIALFVGDQSEIYKAINSRLPEAVGAIARRGFIVFAAGKKKRAKKRLRGRKR